MKCRCDKTEVVHVKIPADLSSTGEEKWRDCEIDKCIASIVRALQSNGIDMRGSCCGHGETCGEIALQDGRTLLIIDPRMSDSIVYDIHKLISKINMLEKRTEDMLAE